MSIGQGYSLNETSRVVSVKQLAVLEISSVLIILRRYGFVFPALVLTKAN